MIAFEDLSVAKGAETLLAPVSASADRAQALVVRGGNGAGKTTLLRVLAGALAPSTGAVRLDGRTVDERDPLTRRRIAAMIGLPPFAPDLTLVDHLTLVATTWLGDAHAAAELADAVLAELSLTGLRERFPHELSSGQTQLFGLALVIARPFDVLILDEPEQRLDAEHLASLIDALRARRDGGAALVIATHSAALSDAVGDRTLVLDAAA